MEYSCYLYRYICFIIFTIPITKIIDNFIPFVNTGINVTMTLLVSIYLLFYKRSGYIEKYNISLLGAIYLLSFMLSQDKVFALVEQLKLTLFILLMILASDIRFIEYVKIYFIKNKKWIYTQLIICNILLLISIFLRSSYEEVWDGIYFKSFFKEPHLFTAYLFYIMSLTLLIIKNIKSSLKYLLIIMILCLSLFTGARVISISIILLVLLWLIKDKKYKSIILLVITSMVVIILFGKNIPLIAKFISATENEYGGIMSGRDVFVLEDIKEYFKFSPLYILVGKGIDYPNLFNMRIVGKYIYAHNDIVNTLLSNGLLGLYIYIYNFYKLYISHKKNISRINLIILISIYFINIILNGLFAYSSITYALFLLILLIENNERKLV